MEPDIVEFPDGRYERRPYEADSRVPAMGRTTVIVTCPFCGERVVAYLWSLAGSGKRCPCGAKFSGHGASYKQLSK